MRLEDVGKSKSTLYLSRGHSHDTWELCYNVKGSGTATSGDMSYLFQPGTVVLCPPGVSHAKTSEEGFEDLFIHFSGCGFASRVYVLKDDYDKKLFHLIHVLHTAYYENRSGAVCDALFEAIMGLVHPALESPRQNKYVQQLQQTIINEFTNPDFLLQDAMKQIPLNKDHLRRLFKETLGLTPHRYLLQLRMESAKRILGREEDAGVAEVAFRCGFYDPLYFSRAFHKYTGISPTQWK